MQVDEIVELRDDALGEMVAELLAAAPCVCRTEESVRFLYMLHRVCAVVHGNAQFHASTHFTFSLRIIIYATAL